MSSIFQGSDIDTVQNKKSKLLSSLYTLFIKKPDIKTINTLKKQVNYNLLCICQIQICIVGLREDSQLDNFAI